MDPGIFFGRRPFCRLSEAIEAATDVAVDIDEPVDVVIIPPDPNVDTDEEEGDDDGMTDVVVNDVSGVYIYIITEIVRLLEKQTLVLSSRHTGVTLRWRRG